LDHMSERRLVLIPFGAEMMISQVLLMDCDFF
jgi:hypothetical protein